MAPAFELLFFWLEEVLAELGLVLVVVVELDLEGEIKTPGPISGVSKT
jgi:hypothetical protein